jgi:chromosome partitioning protein
MRTIAVLNQKGGVGKTTTSVNTAAALAEAGVSTAVIDLDPQSHASLHLGTTADESRRTTYGALLGETRLIDVLRPVGPKLAVAPAHIDLSAAETELATAGAREQRLRHALAAHAPAEVVIVDCPPSLGLLSLNALCAADEVLLPLQPHFLALHGLSQLMRTIDLVGRRLNPGLKLTGVVLCMYEHGTRLAREVASDVHDFFARAQAGGAQGCWTGARLLQTRIRRNIRLAEAPSFGRPVLEYDTRCSGSIDYRALAAELMTLWGMQPASCDEPAAQQPEAALQEPGPAPTNRPLLSIASA